MTFRWPVRPRHFLFATATGSLLPSGPHISRSCSAPSTVPRTSPSPPKDPTSADFYMYGIPLLTLTARARLAAPAALYCFVASRVEVTLRLLHSPSVPGSPVWLCYVCGSLADRGLCFCVRVMILWAHRRGRLSPGRPRERDAPHAQSTGPMRPATKEKKERQKEVLGMGGEDRKAC